MLDPITSLLAACVNCNPPDSHAVEPDVSICTNHPRSNQNAAQQHAIQQNSLSGCISPPESTSESLPLRSFTTVAAVDTNQRQTQNQTVTAPRPIAPESVVAVSWSNPAGRAETKSATAENTTHPVLQFGSRGQDVMRLQTQLQQLKLYPGAIDGIFGQQTKAAVAQFQRSKGLQADAVVGANTWTALQSVVRQPQSANPTQANTPSNNQGDRPATPPPSSSATGTPAASPTTEAEIAQPSIPQSTESNDQSDQKSDSSPQFPFNSLWIVGWGIIYGSGWVLILKDTAKEIKGFHFVITPRKKTAKQTRRTVVSQVQSNRKVGTKVVIPSPQHQEAPVDPSPAPVSPNYSAAVESQVQPQSVQPVNFGSSDRTDDVTTGAIDRSSQLSNQHSNQQPTPNRSDRSNVKPFALEQFVIADPWQDEVETFSLQIFEVALADGGQILPIQNVFIAPPRSRFTRTKKRPKKAALIANYSYYSYPKPIVSSKPEVASSHDAKNRHQQAKAG